MRDVFEHVRAAHPGAGMVALRALVVAELRARGCCRSRTAIAIAQALVAELVPLAPGDAPEPVRESLREPPEAARVERLAKVALLQGGTAPTYALQRLKRSRPDLAESKPPLTL